MASTQSSTQQQLTQITQFNPTQINSDVIWGHVSMLLIDKLNISMNRINLKTIVKLILVVCLFEIKVGCVEIFKYLKNNSKDFFKNTLEILKRIFEKLRFRRQPCIEFCSPKIYTLNISDDTIKTFVKFIENKENTFITFNETTDSKIVYTSKHPTVNRIYSNITVEMNDCLFEFLTQINSQANKESVKNNIQRKTFNIDKTNFNTALCNLVNNEELYIFSLVNKHISLLSIYDLNITDENHPTAYGYIVEMFSKYYYNVLLLSNKANIGYYLYVYKFMYENHSYTYLKQLENAIICMANKFGHCILTTPFNVDFNFDEYKKNMNMFYPKFNGNYAFPLAQNLKPIFSKLDPNLDTTIKIYNHFVKNITSTNNSENNTSTHTENIQFQIFNRSISTSDEEQIKMLLDTISKENKISNKVTTYSVKIVDEEISTEVDNPEYAKYMENKEMIDKILTKTDKLDSVMTIPDKKIKIVKIKKNISSIKVKEQEKSFNTLYLQQNDEKTLLQILENYSSNIFSELELPKKLGILLYGPPGAGKSTTIQVIASYLKKDIYYVNLNGVKTCGDLKMIFDYIVSNCSGIIVFEDIDAQTSIVHKREAIKTSVTDIVEHIEDELNLSYFLNLLDGSLCAEDTMFIMTTNHIDHLDPALYRCGRIDCKLELKPCDRYQIQKMYKTILKEDIELEVLSLIPEYKYAPSEMIYHLVNCSYNRSNCSEMMKKFRRDVPHFVSSHSEPPSLPLTK